MTWSHFRRISSILSASKHSLLHLTYLWPCTVEWQYYAGAARRAMCVHHFKCDSALRILTRIRSWLCDSFLQRSVASVLVGAAILRDCTGATCTIPLVPEQGFPPKTDTRDTRAARRLAAVAVVAVLVCGTADDALLSRLVDVIPCWSNKPSSSDSSCIFLEAAAPWRTRLMRFGCFLNMDVPSRFTFPPPPTSAPGSTGGLVYINGFTWMFSTASTCLGLGGIPLIMS
jgi:hypothetical protein